MDIHTFVSKLRDSYGIRQDLGNAIITEYAQENVDWERTYDNIRDSGKSVTHIGAIHINLVKASASIWDIQNKENERMEALKQRYLQETFTPEYFADFVRRTTKHGWFNEPCIPFNTGIALISFKDLCDIARSMPYSPEKEIVNYLYERHNKPPACFRDKPVLKAKNTDFTTPNDYKA